VKHILWKDRETLGILGLLGGLTVALLSFLAGLPALYYFAFLLTVTGTTLLYRTMQEDLSAEMGSVLFGTISVIFLLLLYFVLRLNLLDFSLIIGDASDYLWSGVGSVSIGDNHGFFLPMAAALAGVGFELFELKFAPLMTTITYSAILPILYLFLRSVGLKALSSLAAVLFFALLPLPVWFSKTTFSEPVWQLLILMILAYSFRILRDRKPTWVLLAPLFILFGLALFTRGSSIFLFGLIVFLALYHFWRFRNTKILFLFSVLLLYFDAVFSVALGIRTKYLIGWQFGHVIHGITLSKMMAIVLFATLLLFVLFALLKRHSDRYEAFNFPAAIVLFALFLKAVVSFYFASLDSRFTFMDKFFHVEFDFAAYHFGYYFALLATLGLIYIYYSAWRGRALFLLLVVFDALFTVPFAMMDAYTEKLHAVFLYWHRYYFSELFLLQFLAIVFALILIYRFVSYRTWNRRYTLPVFLGLTLLPLLFTFHTELFSKVTKHGYLTHASRLYEWVADRTEGKRLYVLYHPTINCTGYTLDHLTGSGFPRLGIKVIEYRKNPPLPQKIKGDFGATEFDDTLLLCLSLQPCQFENNTTVLLDQYYTSLKWLTHNAGVGTTDIGAYLYRMEPTLLPNRTYHITRRSKIVRQFFPPESGWYKINTAWVWSSSNATLFVPPLKACTANECTLKIEFEAFDAAPQKPKEVLFVIGGKEAARTVVTSKKPVSVEIILPPDKEANGTSIEVRAPGAISPRDIHLSVDGRKLGIKVSNILIKSKSGAKSGAE